MCRTSRIAFTAILFITVFLLLPVLNPTANRAFGQGSSVDVESLRGIRTIFVVVESLDDDAKAFGLDKETIKTDVELKLRLAGMKVVSEEVGEGLASPHLYVNVLVVGRTAAIEVNVQEVVRLERNRERTVASTWHEGSLIINATVESVRNNIKDKVDAFLNAWLSVNPKKSS